MLLRIALIVTALTASACAAPAARESEYNLGVAAYKAKDYASAREHWSVSVERGDELSALNNLGYLLYYGMGGAVDMQRAVDLWRKGAARGHSEAQWHLGHAYEDGEAVPRSLVEAYAWYRCSITSAEAAPEDSTEAQVAQGAHKSLTKLLQKLSAEQFSESEALAKRYIESYAKKFSQ